MNSKIEPIAHAAAEADMPTPAVEAESYGMEL